MKSLFNKIGYKISEVEKINTHGGSIRLYINKNQKVSNNSVENIIKEELDFGIDNINIYRKFENEIAQTKRNAVRNISKLKEKYGKIAGYGAPAKASTKLNYYGINSDIISFIVEDNPLKFNKIIPGVDIPIYDVNRLISEGIKIVIVFAWNFYDYIVENNKEIIDQGVEFISIKDLEKSDF